MRILIIENKPNIEQPLVKLLKEVAPNKMIICNCSGVQESLQWFSENEYPDLVLSEIQLVDGLCFEIFKQLTTKVPVIFICNYTKYAVEAFKVGALHYLLKPIQKDDLIEAINRYDNNSKLKKKEIVITKVYQERFVINIGMQTKILQDKDIAYFFIRNKLVFAVSFEDKKYSIDFTLDNLEKILNPKIFYRINRQFIVQYKSIAKMLPASKQRMELTLNPPTHTTAFTSFERTPNFKKWLTGMV